MDKRTENINVIFFYFVIFIILFLINNILSDQVSFINNEDEDMENNILNFEKENLKKNNYFSNNDIHKIDLLTDKKENISKINYGPIFLTLI